MKMLLVWGVAGLCLFALFLRPAAFGDQPEIPLPIVYSKHYNITLYGIQKLHPFDSEKYGRVYKYLEKNAGLSPDRIYEPEEISELDLLRVHSREYLNSLKKSTVVAEIAEMGALKFMPGFLLDKKILKPMRYATGGTVLASRLALQYGWSVNLSGGYHHAKANQGEGFCFYADIPVAAHLLWEQSPGMKIMVVDLDVHQGNGHEAIFKDDPRVFIFDMYNAEIYPRDKEAAEYIDFNLPVDYGAKDEEYLALLRENLEPAIIQCNPDLIFYNAGTDIYKNDPLGVLSISEKGIMDRDEEVFRTAGKLNVPVAMVLSGGYTKESAGIIARSIENLLKNVFKAGSLRMAEANRAPCL
ncbi:histone deacetylase 11 [Desulfatibacillum alkenivorans DSM 16219]|jgi:histone deacetylase 11|uniref:histone deacetylase n=1 Tax=Desulfatibacillum alkenivorans DSM 16219 TaxID=1121393 RepID=A0A1M6GMU6_9BACT|nr:histone deacetylase [Desulfatibacillum alkenivorans]SHJ11241.1 histone deacetylase 11 [Desulfatibacillum alkenivorans DSM 16219]